MGPSHSEQEGALTLECRINFNFSHLDKNLAFIRIKYLDDWKYLRSYDKRKCYYCLARLPFIICTFVL